MARNWRELVWLAVFVLLFGAAMVAMSAIAHCPNCAARGLPRPCGSRGIPALDLVPELQPRMSGFDLICVVVVGL
jgi:hypothetical protein